MAQAHLKVLSLRFLVESAKQEYEIDAKNFWPKGAQNAFFKAKAQHLSYRKGQICRVFGVSRQAHHKRRRQTCSVFLSII
ncbi:MAG: hypothetical protein DRQ02_04365 [Candidatus Latescibacterota bacterium]|nr:MAG: hypothetical protein DRQ02_04365 [Candidatus Latescibacterota bacterium]RKY77602.1 MAG: hypothetical protein DRQ12_07930 [candidate division KSB1 bacterium]